MPCYIKKHFKVILLIVLAMICQSTVSLSCDYSAANKCHDNRTAKTSLYEKDRQQAILTNIQELAHICCSNPTRQVNGTERYLSHIRGSFTRHLFNYQKVSFLNYRGCLSLQTTPIIILPSCNYYVFALRHLLC